MSDFDFIYGTAEAASAVPSDGVQVFVPLSPGPSMEWLLVARPSAFARIREALSLAPHFGTFHESPDSAGRAVFKAQGGFGASALSAIHNRTISEHSLRWRNSEPAASAAV